MEPAALVPRLVLECQQELRAEIHASIHSSIHLHGHTGHQMPLALQGGIQPLVKVSPLSCFSSSAVRTAWGCDHINQEKLWGTSCTSPRFRSRKSMQPARCRSLLQPLKQKRFLSDDGPSPVPEKLHSKVMPEHTLGQGKFVHGNTWIY